MQGGSRWYVYNRAPFSVSHRFPFPSILRPFPFHTISVSFRFAGFRFGSFPFHSVSWYGVSQIFRFVSFRFVSCPDSTVSPRFVFSVSHRFVSFRVQL